MSSLIEEYGSIKEGEYSIIQTRNAKQIKEAQDRARAIAYNPSPMGTKLPVLRSAPATYGTFNDPTTAALGFNHMKNTKNENGFLFYDLEALGTPSHMRKEGQNIPFHITEFAAIQTNNAGGRHNQIGNPISMVIAPSENTNKYLNELIGKIRKNGAIGLNEDERRTARDLILYSNKNAFSQSNFGPFGFSTVDFQSRELMPDSLSSLGKIEHIKNMERGLRNLNQFGTPIPRAVQVMNETIKGNTMVGYNNIGYDQHALLSFVDEAMKSNSKVNKNIAQELMTNARRRQVDVLSIVRTAEQNPLKNFGLNFKLDQQDRFFPKAGNAHMGIIDVGATIGLANEILGNSKYDEFFNNGKFDYNRFQVGDTVFSKKGKGKYNSLPTEGVFTFSNDGGLVPAYSGISPNPLYKNTEYKVASTIQEENLGTKKYYSVMLENSETGHIHKISAETPQKLSGMISEHLEYIRPDMATFPTVGMQQGKEQSAIDKANRRYRKIFSSGGEGGDSSLLARVIEVYDELKDGGRDLSNEELASKLKESNKYITKELVRDVRVLEKRLDSEMAIFKKFAENRGIGNQELGFLDKKANDYALGELGALLDKEAPLMKENLVLQGGSHSLFIEDNMIVFNTEDELRGGLRREVYRGKPNERGAKKNLVDTVYRLKTQGLLNEKQAVEYYNQIRGLAPNDSIDGLLHDISIHVKKEKERLSMNGELSYIEMETANSMRSTRKLSALEQSLENIMPTLVEEGENRARGVNGSKLTLKEMLGKQGFVDQYETGFKNIMSSSGIASSGYEFSTPGSTFDMLDDVLGEFNRKGLSTTVRYSKHRKALELLVYDGQITESVMNANRSELNKNQNVAVIDLPSMNKDGGVKVGTVSRLNSLEMKSAKGGAITITDMYAEAFGAIKTAARTIGLSFNEEVGKGEKFNFKRAESTAKRYVNNRIGSRATNNSRIDANEVNRTYKPNSKAQRMNTASSIGVVGMAEDWLVYSKGKHNWLPSVDEVRARMQSNGGTFFENMGYGAMNQFNKEASSFVELVTGIKTSTDSVGGEQALDGRRSLVSIQETIAFGHYSGMARENLSKTVNYMSIDSDRIIERLSQMGMDAQDIEQTVYPILSTDRGFQAYSNIVNDGESSYLNVPTQRLTNKSVSDAFLGQVKEIETRLKALEGQTTNHAFIEKQKLERLLAEAQSLHLKGGVFDGNFLISQSMASVYDTASQSRIRVSESAELTSEFKKFIEAQKPSSKINKTPDGEIIMFNEPINMASNQLDGLRNKDGKVTIGYIQREEYKIQGNEESSALVKNTRRLEDGVFDKGNDRQYNVIGWDGESKSLIIEQIRDAREGTKFITNHSGDRVTAVTVSDELMAMTFGENIRAVLPTLEEKKRMGSGEIAEKVNQAIYSAQASLKKEITTGQIKKEEVLNQVIDIAQRNLGLEEGTMTIRNGTVFVRDNLGKDGNAPSITRVQLESMTAEVNKRFNTNITASQYVVGLGIQDIPIYNFSMGIDESGRNGKVKTGITEMDMIIARARREIGEDSATEKFIRSHTERLSQVQNERGRRVGSSVLRAMTMPNTPGLDDVLFTSEGVVSENKRIGARRTDGAIEFSLENIEKLPEKTTGSPRTILDYEGTVFNLGSIDAMYDGKEVGGMIAGRGGVAYMELPKGVFDKDYIKLIDFGGVTSINGGEMAIETQLERKQGQVYEGIREYLNIGKDRKYTQDEIDSIKQKINQNIKQLDELTVDYVLGNKEDSLIANRATVRDHMSGHFRSQGANPYSMYEMVDGSARVTVGSELTEGIKRISPTDLLDMFSGAEYDTLRALGVSTKGMSLEDAQQELIRQSKNENIFAQTKRAPYLKQDTIIPLALVADESLGQGQSLVPIGTAQLLNLDNDGDTIASMVSHYGSSDASAVHQEMRRMNQSFRLEAIDAGLKEFQDIYMDEQVKTKVGAMSSEELIERQIEIAKKGEALITDEDRAIQRYFEHTFETQSGPFSEIEVDASRLGKGEIGYADNTRARVISGSSAVLDSLEAGGMITRERAASMRKDIEEVMAAVSQAPISSKKFTVSDMLKDAMEQNPQATHAELVDIVRGKVADRSSLAQELVSNIAMGGSMNIERVMEINNELGIVKIADEAAEARLRNTLSTVQELGRLSAPMGGFNSDQLKIGTSSAKNYDNAASLISGRGNALFRTERLMEIFDAGDEALKTTMTAMFERGDNIIQAGYISGDVVSEELLSGSGRTPAPLGADIEVSTSKFKGNAVGSAMAKGAFGGAIGFGAMWAMSAASRPALTPEGMQDRGEYMPEHMSINAISSGPTARIVQQDEGGMSIRISGRATKEMTTEQISSIIHNEINSTKPQHMSVNSNINVNDNTNNLGRDWAQTVVANAIGQGLGF